MKRTFVILRPSFSASDWPNNRLTFLNVTRQGVRVGRELLRTPTLGIELPKVEASALTTTLVMQR